MIYVNALDYTIQVITNEDGEIVVTTDNNSTISAATQSQVNTGMATGVYVSPATLQDKDDTAVALVDGATIDITGPKHTLTTANGRTLTISHAGDHGVIEITLNATSATFTFPSAWKCWAEGISTGDNTLGLSGTSGDRYFVAWTKIGSNFYAASKNTFR